METIKFTTDGKKVAVIGKLNNVETIVQEIFIVNNQEVPSGENFVVKSLHDAPAESWKAKNLRELEERYEVERQEFNRKIDLLRTSFKREQSIIEGMLKSMKKLSQSLSETDFERLVMFVSGGFTHFLKNSYGYMKIMSLDEMYNEYGVKLLTIFGSKDGALDFKINQYGDGSGSYSDIIPCKSYEEAKSLFLEEVIKDGDNLREDTVKEADKHGISLPYNILKNLYEKQKKSAENNKKVYEDNISKVDATLRMLDEKINNLQPL